MVLSVGIRIEVSGRRGCAVPWGIVWLLPYVRVRERLGRRDKRSISYRARLRKKKVIDQEGVRVACAV
jgi:hypothetical protein